MSAAQLRTRSLGGCGTCRSRHSKCDETRPVCNVCRHHGVLCQGYQSRLLFVQNGQSEDASEIDDTATFRRPLFSVHGRLKMSEDLQASIASSSVSSTLSKLDAQSESLHHSNGDDAVLTFGPFTAFKVCSRPPAASSSDLRDQDPEPTLKQTEIAGGAPDPLLDMLFSGIAPSYLFDLGQYDLNTLSDEHDDITILEETQSPSRLEQSNNEPQDSTPVSSHPLLPIDKGNNIAYDHHDQRFTFEPIPEVVPFECRVPSDAVFLLSHYRTNVIKLLSPLKYHRKLPWNVLHVPCAMNTLAELTMGNKASHAASGVFYSLLATSAFSLRRVSTGNADTYWKNVGLKYQVLAQDYLKMSLMTEVPGPQKAKYKVVLMAILSMVTVSVFGGNVQNAMTYLLDAERFIRLRGIPKVIKSRKVRLLHHCYAYLRIMLESTTVLLPDSSFALSDDFGAIPRRTMPASPSFRFSNWTLTGDLQLSRNKDIETGQNDIHLEIPGEWHSTLYPNIYGIPESFMVLLSQATRLGNERDIIRTRPSEASISLGHLYQCAKDLEKHICQWNPLFFSYPEGSDVSIDPALISSNKRVISYMLQAFHQALIVFFYRRIYDVNPMVIQPNVEKTIGFLEKIQEEDTRAGEYTIGIVWPSFIAACEATGLELQQRFSTWFSESEKNSGLATFDAARTVAGAVWRKRAEAGNFDFSWVDELRARQTILLCT